MRCPPYAFRRQPSDSLAHGEVAMKMSQREQIRRVLIHGPAFPHEVAAATGINWRICSAVLDRMCKRGEVIRSEERIKRPGMNSAYLYSLRHRRWRFWTTHDVKRLRALAAAGKSPQQIARELGRTVTAVRHRAKRMGLSLNVRKQTVWPAELKMRAAVMKASGSTWLEISKELGVPLGTVQQWGNK